MRQKGKGAVKKKAALFFLFDRNTNAVVWQRGRLLFGNEIHHQKRREGQRNGI